MCISVVFCVNFLFLNVRLSLLCLYRPIYVRKGAK